MYEMLYIVNDRDKWERTCFCRFWVDSIKDNSFEIRKGMRKQ